LHTGLDGKTVARRNRATGLQARAAAGVPCSGRTPTSLDKRPLGNGRQPPADTAGTLERGEAHAHALAGAPVARLRRRDHFRMREVRGLAL